MSENENQPAGDQESETTSDRDELRTIAFRMREIQRLLSLRVEQENRRLEAEGVEPVDDARFLDDSVTDDPPDE